MRLEEKLKTLSQEEIWQEYCGFLDLSMEEYMSIQNRLAENQRRTQCHRGWHYPAGYDKRL